MSRFMASFDIITAARKGYGHAWRERGYLGRMAIVPVLIKLVCYTAVMTLGWQSSYLKMALVMLPAFFAEGWLLSHFIRLIFLDQRWPFRSSGDEENDRALLNDRARGILSGTIFYVLVNFLMIGFFSIVGGDMQQTAGLSEVAVTNDETTVAIFMVLIVFMAVSVWGFRLVWFYIPAALNYGLFRFVRDITGFSTSFYMMGVWILCFFPTMFLLIFFSSSLVAPYQDDLSSIPATLDFSLIFLQVIANTIASIIVTAGMAYGIQQIMERKAAA